MDDGIASTSDPSLANKITGRVNYVSWYNGTPYVQLLNGRSVDASQLVGRKLRVTIHDDCVCDMCGEPHDSWRSTCDDCFGEAPPQTRCVMNPGSECTYAECPYPEYKRDDCSHTFVVYLVAKDEVKVGITRAARRVKRWAGQGASHGLVIAEAPNRKAAGIIEDALSERFPTRAGSGWYEPLSNPVDVLVEAAQTVPQFVPGDDRLHACLSVDGLNESALASRVVRIPGLTDGIQHTRAAKRNELSAGETGDGTVLGVRGSVIMTDEYAFNAYGLGGYRVTFETNTSGLIKEADH